MMQMVQFQLDSNGKCAVTLKDVGNVGDCVPEKKDGEREAKAKAVGAGCGTNVALANRAGRATVF